MAGSGNITAGKAFVTLSLKDLNLAKGLAKLSKDIKAFGRSITDIGKKLSIMGSAIAAPLVAAAASWARSGAELYKLSQKTNVSTEALSGLQYAAEQLGGSGSAIGGAMQSINSSMAAAKQGSAAAHVAFARLGLSFRDLQGLKPEEQFEMIADRISRIKDPAMQADAAVAALGGSAMELLPMLKQGRAGIEAYRKEAEAMGYVKTEESVKSAFELDKAFRRVTGGITNLTGAIGSALAPLLTAMSTCFSGVVNQAREWIKVNKALVNGVFILGASLLGAGVSLLIVGKAISIVSSMFAAAGKILSLFGSIASLALIPLRMGLSFIGGAAEVAFSVLKSAVSGVIKGFSVLASVAIGACKIAINGLVKGFEIFGDVAAGAVSLVVSGFRIAAKGLDMFWSVATTVGKTSIGILKFGIETVTHTFQMFTRAVGMAQDIMSGIVSVGTTAISSLVSLSASLVTGLAGILVMAIAIGPILLPIIAVVGALAAKAGSSVKAMGQQAGSSIRGMGQDAMRAGTAAGQQLTNSARLWGGAAMEGAKTWGGAIKGFFGGMGAMVSTVIGRIRNTVVAGFQTVSDDVMAVWGTLQESLQAGDMTSVWTVVCATLKLEWARFSLFLQETWEELKPMWNTTVDYFVDAWNRSVEGAAKLAGGLYTELKIGWIDIISKLTVGWGDMWQSLMRGLKKVFDMIDTGIDAIFDMMIVVKAFMTNLPGASKSSEYQSAHDKKESALEVKNGEDEAGYRARMKQEGVADKDVSWKRFYKGVDPLKKDKYADDAGDAADIKTENKFRTRDRLSTNLAKAETPEERAARVAAADKDRDTGVAAANAAGKAIEERVGGLKIANAPHAAADPNVRARGDAAIAAAAAERDQALAAAKAKNAAFKAEQDKKRNAIPGGPDISGMASQTKISGTFSGAAARMQGGQSGFQMLGKKMDRFIFHGEESTTELKNVNKNLKVK